MRKASIFDKDTIRKNCEEFFSLYNVTKAGTLEICIRKTEHTRRVAQNCVDIAHIMGLDDYDCDMAWTIGELHDFARFGQAVVTKSTKDSDRYNHAKLGARLLFTHRMIDDIILNYEDICTADRIVMEKAVYHHSDYMLPDDLTDRELLFCDIIRDADKIDIFRTSTIGGWKSTCGYTEEEIFSADISPKVEEAFYQHRTANNADCATPADYHLRHIAMCFGLTSEAARRTAVKQGYLQQLMSYDFERPEVQRRYIRMRDEAAEFMHIKKGGRY